MGGLGYLRVWKISVVCANQMETKMTAKKIIPSIGVIKLFVRKLETLYKKKVRKDGEIVDVGC